jgi:uncharacterized phage-associated protein
MIISATIIESLYYILKKIGKSDKLKLTQLMYLSDKYHLLYFGRTITNDDYYATQYGLVGTTVKDILSFDPSLPEEESFISKEEKDYFLNLIEKVENYNFKAKEKDIPFNMLSETDKEALDFVIKKFGNMSSSKLVELTHKYSECNKYKDLFNSKLTKRKRIDTIELLSTIKNDPLEVSKEHIGFVKEMLSDRLIDRIHSIKNNKGVEVYNIAEKLFTKLEI